MSTLQVANINFEATGVNRIRYLGGNNISITAANTVSIFSGSANAIVANSSFASMLNGKLNVNATAVSISTGVGIFANGSLGVAGQALTSNGSSLYWAPAGISLAANSSDSQTYYLPMTNTTSGTWSNGVISTTKLYFVPSTGSLSATDFNSLSDEKYKNNIKTIENPLEKVLNIRGVSFDWKDDNRPSIGVIAQEIEKVLPELVTEHNGIKTVNYDGLIGLLIEVVKELIQDKNKGI